MSKDVSVEELFKGMTEEEEALARAEIKRRDELKQQAELEKRAYVRYQAFAICNRCKRALSEDVFKANQVCPYCGGESATLIEHEEEKQ